MTFPALRRRAALAAVVVAASFTAPVLAVAPTAHAADPATPSEAAQAPERTYSYRFYLGGILVGKADVAAAIDEVAYRLQTDVRSDGVVGWFYDVTVKASAEGARRDADTLAPRRFVMSSVTEGELFDMTVSYGESAPETIEAEPAFKPRPWQIDPARQTGALDPISAIVAALLPRPVADLCEHVIPIFDGRRRYDIVFDGVRADKTRRGERQIDCDARFQRVGGFKPKHMAKPDIPFIVRFAVAEDGDALPIRAWASTEFGAAVATLARLNGRKRR